MKNITYSTDREAFVALLAQIPRVTWDHLTATRVAVLRFLTPSPEVGLAVLYDSTGTAYPVCTYGEARGPDLGPLVLYYVHVNGSCPFAPLDAVISLDGKAVSLIFREGHTAEFDPVAYLRYCDAETRAREVDTCTAGS